jgi:hypothetical protein
MMNIVMVFLLFITLILKNINGASSFDTQAYALANPCVWSACDSGLPSQDQNYIYNYLLHFTSAFELRSAKSKHNFDIDGASQSTES